MRTPLRAFSPHSAISWAGRPGALWTVQPDETGGTRTPPSLLSLVHMRQQPGVAPAGLLGQSQPPAVRKGQGLAGRVWEQKKPLSLFPLSAHRGAPHHRAAARMGLRSAFAFPILLAGEVHGVIELFTREKSEPGERLLAIVGSVGIQIGLFIERTQALGRLRKSEEALIQVNNALDQRVRERTAELHEANHELSAEIAERTRLEREIIRISEREQRRIGQDLHDGVCQELAAIAFMTRALATRLGRSGNGETQRINEVAQLLNDSISRCRDIARGLHPVEMDADGLMVALNDLAMRTHQSITCSFQCDEPILMPESDVALNLYRIAQEAVNNAIKYSRARRIAISLDRRGTALRLSIGDDGRGIPSRAAPLSARARRHGPPHHALPRPGPWAPPSVFTTAILTGRKSSAFSRENETPPPHLKKPCPNLPSPPQTLPARIASSSWTTTLSSAMELPISSTPSLTWKSAAKPRTPPRRSKASAIGLPIWSPSTFPSVARTGSSSSSPSGRNIPSSRCWSSRCTMSRSTPSVRCAPARAGYIMKQEALDRVMSAIRQVLHGELYVSPSMSGRMIEEFVQGGSGNGGSTIADKLTDRELEILQLIGQGHGVQQIARELNLSAKTVETHRAHIKEKLNFQTARELARFAVQWVDQQVV